MRNVSSHRKHAINTAYSHRLCMFSKKQKPNITPWRVQDKLRLWGRRPSKRPRPPDSHRPAPADGSPCKRSCGHSRISIRHQNVSPQQNKIIMSWKMVQDGTAGCWFNFLTYAFLCCFFNYYYTIIIFNFTYLLKLSSQHSDDFNFLKKHLYSVLLLCVVVFSRAKFAWELEFQF